MILGEGPDRPSLEALVRELGLGDRVAMPGYAPDVTAWLRRARLFVLSSRHEGLPAVVLEAMASECPVLTTNCFLSARTLVGEAEGCAVIADPVAESLARAIEACWVGERPSTLSKVAQRFSIANGVQSHVDAIREALVRPAECPDEAPNRRPPPVEGHPCSCNTFPISIACSAPVFGTISPPRPVIASQCAATPSTDTSSPDKAAPGVSVT